MSSKYDGVTLGGGERIPLPATEKGTRYGSSRVPGLRIVSYIGGKETKNPGEFRHSFLVRSALNGEGSEAIVQQLSSGADVGQYAEILHAVEEGSAFLAFSLRESWLGDDDGVLALAFNRPELAEPLQIQDAEIALKIEAARKAQADNVPEDKLEAEVEARYPKLLQQIRISVGNIFRLQDWGGRSRDARVSLASLEGIKFSGTIKATVQKGGENAGKVRAEVDYITTCRLEPR